MRSRGRGAPGAIAVRREPGGRQPVRISGGLVEKLLDDDTSNPLSAAPLWAFGPELVPLLDGLSGPPYELADAVERAIAAGLRDRRSRDRADAGLDGSG